MERPTMLRAIVLLMAICAARASFARTVSISLPVADDRAAEDGIDLTRGLLLDGVFETLYARDLTYLHNFSGIDLVQRTVMEFSLAELAPQSSIVRAVLTVHEVGRTLQRMDMRLFGFAGDGAIAPADFAANRYVGSSTLPAFPSDNVLTYDVTEFLEALRAVGATHAGFAFQVSYDGTLSLASKECPQERLRPRLEVTYTAVPEPGAVSLVCMSLLVLAGMRKVSMFSELPLAAI
jgi:hypothetical protein